MRIGVFSLGGTIAMTPVDRPDGGSSAGVAPRLGAEDLVTAIPQLSATGAALEMHDVRILPSASLRFGDLHDCYAAIRSRFEDLEQPIDAAVVTQGTDTIEETAWLLDLLHTGDQPLVVTGAMRNPTQAGADGPANVLGAVRLASHPDAAGLGALVTLADEIHAARDVRKGHTTSPASFVSPNLGPLGRLTEGVPRIWQRPRRLDRTRARALTAAELEAPRVAVLPIGLGQDGAMLAAASGFADGLVVAGMGAGHVPAGLARPLGELAQRIPVVLATRVAAGPVTTRTYGFAGSEVDLLARGLIGSGHLDPMKSRVLLQVLLAEGAALARVAEVFADTGAF